MMKNVVGVDMGCTKMLMVAEVDGQLVEHKVSTGLDCSLEYLAGEIDRFIAGLPYEPEGLGIALPGLVEGDRRLQFSDIRALCGVTADDFAKGRFRCRLINDVKAATVAEAANYPEKDTVAVMMAGSGLALGVYSKQRMYTGAGGFAGELGYTVIATEAGPRKVDELAGGIGILDKAGCDIDAFLAKIRDGDGDSLALLERAGFYCGLAITNVLHLFNPDVLVIGGSTSTYPGYMDNALRTAEKHTLPDMFQACSFASPKDGKRIAALGAMQFLRTGMEF
ncbi:putative NBD/HSP70 family sugar kinase [Paenibacillus favisporus]|uniref:NBD/HSP70 family sugar kinase n=1 Tax=Paenibacillus favisporus TaxID=221028 RepID=A0ABV2EWP2_9BACL